MVDIDESVKHAVVTAINRKSAYPQESYLQIAEQFGLDPKDVIKIYEESIRGN